jgi:hypothetical protein
MLSVAEIPSDFLNGLINADKKRFLLKGTHTFLAQ